MNHRSTWAALPLLAVLIIMLLASPSTALANGGEWTWMSGSNTVNQAGVYGVQGIPDPANMPGARSGSISWIDGAGDLWLFGGIGRDGAGDLGAFNDLWRYGVNRQWTWMSGADAPNQAGVYGVEGTPDPANVPGARWGSISWIDGAGNLWLFGGYSRDGAGNWGWLNDLWRYDANGEWAWMSGANVVDQAGVYGAQGTPAPANVPGARGYSISWIDGAGNLWLFGGYGRDNAGNLANLNDLWRYGADGEWAWISGANTVNQAGVYGTQGTPDPANVPGARYDSISWIDGAGNLWLFGGVGRDGVGSSALINDLWRYDANGQWTWMSGADTVGQVGIYGTQGNPHPGNVPGARYGSISWIDGAGDLWLFGGLGLDHVGNPGSLNDLWRYDTNMEWTWMSGANTVGQGGVYGNQGMPDPANVPGARGYSVSWIDDAGNLWLFGGSGLDGAGNTGSLNDLWRYSSQSPNAAIEVVKTLGVDPGVCAAESNITVPGGTEVYYCYTVTNTGDVTLNHHDLMDDQLGMIFSGLNYALVPGDSVNTVAAGLTIPAVINTTTTNVATWTAYNNPDGIGGFEYPHVFALAVGPDGSLYAGGLFTTAGGIAANHIARWDGAQWHSLGSGMSDSVFALAVGPDGSLYAGGYFTTAGGVAANHVARWDGSQWHPLSSGMGGYVATNVESLAVSPDGSLYAGGRFTTAGGVAANHIARWDGAQWHPLGSGMPAGDFTSVYALAIGPDGSLYAGGYFTTAGGVAVNGIARWDGAQWYPVGGGTSGYVRSLTFAPDGSLYAGGVFATAGGVAANNVAYWDGAQWYSLDSGIDNTVLALAVEPDGSLYAGGHFTAAGGVAANHIARWDGAQWHPLGSGMTGPIHALAVRPGGSLYAGGGFLTAGEVRANSIAQWDGVRWYPLRSGPSAQGTASATVSVVEGYFSCQNPVENFGNGVPPWGWTVVNNAPGGPVWGDIASCGPNGNGGNWTGGLGDAACISGSTLEPGEYDAELRTPVFSLAGYSESTISFLLNYQNWAGIDRLTFDISADGGATWAPLRIYTTDQGAFQNTPGVRITTDLADYLGQANLMLRWRYNWNDPAALGWYAQIDEAEFRCIQIPPTAVTLAGLETDSRVGIGWGWLLAIAASGLALTGALAGRRKGQAGLR